MAGMAGTVDGVGRQGRRFGRGEQARFLRLLAETGSVEAAAAETGVAERAVERVRQTNAAFAAACDAVFDVHRQRLEEKLIASVLGTLPEAEQKRFNPALAMKLLQMRGGGAGDARSTPQQRAASQEEVDAALTRKLVAIGRARGGA